MRILRPHAHIAPVTMIGTHLTASCTSIILTRASPQTKIYLITVFFPVDRSEPVSKHECEQKVPITAMALGDLRNSGRKEIVTINSSGLLQCLDFPTGTESEPLPAPARVFSQQIYPNVCSMELLDIDGDGLTEMVVVMTDRVVRSYRYAEQACRVVPLNKWEMPAQISGWTIGLGSTNYALISQTDQSHYVRLDFGPSKDVKVIQSKINEDAQCTQFVVPPHPFSVRLIHCLAEKIIV
ncbi:integrin-alpha FG-GAP repeat-containing protein 2-like protein, partial [Aphelenchoides avenae]